MVQEKELIKKRASIKGRLTAFSTYMDTLDKSLASSQAAELQLRIGKIEGLYEQYDEIQLALECSAEDIQVQMKERTEFESLYYKLVSRAQLALSSYEAEKDPPGSQKGSSHASNHRLVKLPTIQLPKFSGSYEGWLEFHDTFSSLIHGDEEMDEINKFHYLRASLEGSAALVIQSIGFSAANYSVAWKLLCDRFDNKRLLIQNHVAALFNLEVITKESSVTLKRLIDQVKRNLRALESLGEPTTHWDTLLIYMITHKLDTKTLREWEEHKGRLDKEKPITLTTFLDFIRNRADVLETMELSRNPASTQASSAVKSQPKIKTMMSVQDGNNSTFSPPAKPCPKCDGSHYLNNCPQFLSLSNIERLHLLSNYKVCYNCFRPNHYANHCKKPGCKICKRKHNSIIHVAETKPKLVASAASSHTADFSRPSVSSQPTTHAGTDNNLVLSANVGISSQKGQDVLLSTALVKLYDANNHEQIARALLDSGSTSCLMTESMSRRLNLPTECVDKTIQGVNNATYRIGKRCTATMQSLIENFTRDIQCFILPTITDSVPCRQVDISELNIPSDLCLADPNFSTPADVDLILGADIFWDLLGSQHIKLGDGKPMLHESRLGWIVSGPINSGHASTSSHLIKCNFTKVDSHSSDDVQNLLTRFWQLDEVCPKSSDFSKEEQSCEDFFVKTTTRLDDGRFCARIPLKDDPEVLGDSYQRAKKCLLSFERRNLNRPLFLQKYREFMIEYRDMGHMTECQSVGSHPYYFIPHHGVLRESSTTTKLRVVFNASSPTSTGVSLNNIQMVGPTVQDDLLSILIRFRQHKYVLAADVEKMYRQIAIHPDDRHLQQILWRDNLTEPLKSYQLNTVTYGTASAPFIATRCLKQISLECTDKKVAEIIAHDFYVDDLLTGGDSLGEVLSIRERVTTALASACMPLRKWKSNNPQLTLEPFDSSVNLNIGDAESSKTLGLGWETKSDELCFSISPVISTDNTKRGILSTIAQIFDPLGLLAPCVIRLKMLLQHLWLRKLAWDEPLPLDIANSWEELAKRLPLLNEVRIPRHVLCSSSEVPIDLHIFTDASQSAYGACVYVCSNSGMGKPLVRLLLGKSRVAPIKPTTIPRLELCGALVGVRLYEKAVNSLRARIGHVTFWTDSMIVLGWLKMLPSKLQLFVRTRVAEITEKTAECTWRHVPTDQNPADIISRGVDPQLIHEHDLWWSGPAFLQTVMSEWPVMPGTSVPLPEVKPDVLLHVKEIQSDNFVDFNRFSNLVRLKRAVAYALRFIAACKKQPLKTNHLNPDDLNNAMIVIVRTCQQQSFPEYKHLLEKQSLPKKSLLLKFYAFLDENNLMRVGGRLENSIFPFQKKHPLLIQSTHRFTKLLFHSEHIQKMHAGPQLLLASIREEYWPIGGRSLAKACYRQCVTCSRLRGQVVAPLMGNLPRERLSPGGSVFENVGVDYAGPMLSASRQGRGCRLVKVYIAIFVCFTTKAIHLELVGDLTSNCYMLALRRFISRRGKPINIYSDNGTSFVGAHNELSKFLKTNSVSLSEEVANDGINFHFIPAYSPHFGGLWEAGVKSTKFHLQRVLGNCKLTYEELNTTLVQIEAILNSRPLTPLSSDHNDLMPLTPGHFLVGRPLTALPTPNYEDHSSNYLTRFQRIEQLRQHFWARWSKEYVSELQLRTKWRSGESALKLGSLVLLKDDNLPPLKWRLGRITAVHPGADNVARVADVKTATGTFRRAFSKICPLPDNSY